MTDRRWIALCCTALTLTLLALPTAAAPVPAGAPDPVESSYAAIFAPAPEAGDAAPTPAAAAALVFCCSTTYCCERVPSAECDGLKFGMIIQCAMSCSLC